MKPASIVFDRKIDMLPFRPHADCNLRGSRMSRDVCQGLLADAEQMDFRFVRQPLFEVGLVSDFDSRPLRETLSEPAQPLVEAKIIEDSWVQQMRELSNIVDRLVHKSDTVFDTRYLRQAARADGHEICLDRCQGLTQLVVKLV